MTRRGWSPAAIGVWAAAALTAAVLGVQRYLAAVNDTQPDFGGFFLPAAQAIAAGVSPYTVEGYYYSPLVALLLLPVEASPLAIEYWTALRVIAGVAACVFAALACAPRGAWLTAGVICCGALVTLLWSWPATLDLWAGQVELLVLLAMSVAAFAESRGHRFSAGLALGMGAVIKTWPALFLLWLVRARARTRLRSWLGVAAAAALAVVLTIAAGGPRGLVDLISGALSGGSQPLLAANSVWGLPRILFSETPMAEPVFASVPLRVGLTVVLAVWIAAVAALVLARPGPAFIALFNLAFAVILLLPVSHYFYVLYAVPTLWWWGAQVLRRPRSARAWTVFGVLAVWWIVVFRVPPAGDGFMTTTWPSLLLIFGASAIAVTVSAVGAASLQPVTRRRRSPHPTSPRG